MNGSWRRASKSSDFGDSGGSNGSGGSDLGFDANCPEAYKTGLQDFYGREFLVTPKVLIPRPESEMIVDAVLNLAGKSFLPGVRPAPAKIAEDAMILDVGTGSGCLAITLKLELPRMKVVASDVSREALKIARKNAEKFSAEVEFLQSDLLENVDFSPEVVVANLPYVDEKWEWLDKKALSFEPELALFAEDGGLALIKKLIQNLPLETRFLVLEADPCQHKEIIAVAKTEKLELLEKRGSVLVFGKN